MGRNRILAYRLILRELKYLDGLKSVSTIGRTCQIRRRLIPGVVDAKQTDRSTCSLIAERMLFFAFTGAIVHLSDIALIS
jgi:hypothetical protein